MRLDQDEIQRTLNELLLRKNAQVRPTIVCICGSTRFSEAWKGANLYETLAGKIVLSIGCDSRSDEELARNAGLEIDKAMLDVLHLFKIDMADEILVLNVGNYVGASTSREIEYACRLGKPIRWLEPIEEQSVQTDVQNTVGRRLLP
jgi:hypothetical protein